MKKSKGTKIKEFVRVYEDDTMAYRFGKKITESWDPFRMEKDQFVAFWRFCVVAYRCLIDPERVDRRFRPPKAFAEIPFEKAVEDYSQFQANTVFFSR